MYPYIDKNCGLINDCIFIKNLNEEEKYLNKMEKILLPSFSSESSEEGRFSSFLIIEN